MTILKGRVASAVAVALDAGHGSVADGQFRGGAACRVTILRAALGRVAFVLSIAGQLPSKAAALGALQ